MFCSFRHSLQASVGISPSLDLYLFEILSDNYSPDILPFDAIKQILNQVDKCVLPPQFSHERTDINPYPTAFPYGNGMVLHFYQQQESSTTKTVHKVINKGLKTYV